MYCLSELQWTRIVIQFVSPRLTGNGRRNALAFTCMIWLASDLFSGTELLSFWHILSHSLPRRERYSVEKISVQNNRIFHT
ncbi:hypothetical protein EG68_12527 [Paragonimus skrjabini miyazakii]|uniref:Uncharacterized protein n=1 Tax=Paragonimus skrjabini miyazakii TaxID=59628 RepID=A0A8S9YHG5_9TREM|nr:hypothetical protein EG68_12527 [Paragonimus skrjabini miyazakii]